VRQMTLNLQLNERITFDSFIVGDNAELIDALRNVSQSTEFCWYLWGERGVGRSHLLQSCAYAANQLQLKVMYIALADYQKSSPDIVRGMDQYDIVLWDDVDAIAGLNEWEVALFHAYNQLQAAGSKLICTATIPSLSSSIKLADFRTRLAAGVTYQVKPLRDEEKLAALQQRAKSRGMQLSDSVGRYLLSHCPRDMSALFSCLDQLDSASLEEKRLLTIPFVKSVLLNG
jgi:DnaA family protein